LIVDRETEILRFEQLRKIIKYLNVVPEETLMFGDTIIDTVSAIELNMIPVGISGNPYRFQQYTEYRVLRMLKKPLKYVILQWRCNT